MKYSVKGYCLTEQQGKDLFQTIISPLLEGEVLLDFSYIRFYAPPFFYGLFTQLSHSEPLELLLKRLKRMGLNPTGQKIFEKTIQSFVHKINPKLHQMPIEPNKITIVGGKRVPIIYATNGVWTVITNTGEAEWLANTEIINDPKDYEQLLVDNATQAEEYQNQRFTSNVSTLRCSRCGKKSTTIIGYRKHRRSCLAEAN